MRFGIHLRRAQLGSRRVCGLGFGAGGLFPLSDQFDDEDNEQNEGKARGTRQQLVQISHRAVQPK